MHASRSCIKRKDRLTLKLMMQSNDVSVGDQRKTTAEHMCVHIFITTLIPRNYATLNDINSSYFSCFTVTKVKFLKDHSTLDSHITTHLTAAVSQNNSALDVL